MATDILHAPSPSRSLADHPRALRLRDIVKRANANTSQARGHLDSAEALVIFDFGRGRDSSICRSNQQLAALVPGLGDLPILAQREVSTLLAAQGHLVVDLEDEVRSRRRLGRSDYISTTEVADAAARLLHRTGWQTVAVLAHPAHAARCVATMESTGLRVVMPEISRTQVDYDRSSNQWWTRHPSAWLCREFAVIAHQAMAGNLHR